MSRYAESATVAVRDYLAEHLPASLRAVEIELGLAPEELDDPVDVVLSNAPLDTRSPLLEVFCETMRPIDLRNRIWSAEISVAATYNTDADIEAGELYIYRYVSALTECLSKDTQLNQRVVSCELTDTSFTSFRGPNTITRKIGVVGLEVTVQE
jgi:hypothetical protein